MYQPLDKKFHVPTAQTTQKSIGDLNCRMRLMHELQDASWILNLVGQGHRLAQVACNAAAAVKASSSRSLGDADRKSVV